MQLSTREDDSALDRFLGSSAWRKRVRSRDDVLGAALSLYAEQMEQFGFETRKWQRVPISSGTNLYYVCLFSRHPRALDFWDKTVAKDEKGQASLDI